LGPNILLSNVFMWKKLRRTTEIYQDNFLSGLGSNRLLSEYKSKTSPQENLLDPFCHRTYPQVHSSDSWIASHRDS
jgi:hypothetical protein